MDKKKLFFFLLNFIVVVFFANLSYRVAKTFFVKKRSSLVTGVVKKGKISDAKKLEKTKIKGELGESESSFKKSSLSEKKGKTKREKSKKEKKTSVEEKKDTGKNSYLKELYTEREDSTQADKIFAYALQIDFLINEIAQKCKLSKDYVVSQKQELRVGLDKNFLYIEKEIDIFEDSVFQKFKSILKEYAFFSHFNLEEKDDGVYTSISIEKDGFILYKLKIRRKMEEKHLGEKKQGFKKGKLAIVVDDMGKGTKITSKFLTLPSVVTLSFIPHLKGAVAEALIAVKRGHQVMIHIPMETVAHYYKIEKGKGIRIKMTDKEIEDYLEKIIGKLSMAIGANNHMGSLATQNVRVMRAVMRVLKRHHLFFLDSKTTPRSVCRKVARETAILFGVRDVFLDNVRTEKAIRKMLDYAIKVAKRKGKAIAICHPYPETYQVLKKFLSEEKRKDIIIVPVRELLKKY